MDQKKIKKYYTLFLLIFVCMQPILDLLWLNDGTVPEIFGFTLPTLVRIAFIGIIGLLSLKAIKFEKKDIWVIFYIAAIGVYFVIHHMNCLKFQSVVPGNFGYSFFGEAFYIVRMLIPIAVMYFTYHAELDAGTFRKVLMTVSVLLSSNIIITNILKIGYGTYSEELIEGNIFDWFFHVGAFTSNQLASKGFLQYGITAIILVLIYPYMLYLYMEKRKGIYLGAAFMQSISLLMIGTKATAFSVIIVSVLMFVIYLFVTLIKRDMKFSGKVGLVLAVMVLMNVGIFQYSPSVVKMNFDNEYEEAMDEEESKETNEYDLSEENKDEIIRFFHDNYQIVSIKEQFLQESYPYKYDPVFWYHIYTDLVPSQRMQNRYVEEAMLQRVKEINNNKYDDLLGIGFTRTSHIYNLEKDFLYQYYSVGIVGTILLLGPYILIIAGMILLMLWKFKERVTLFNCSLVLGAGLSSFFAYYSGNVMENLGITIVFGFVLGYLLCVNIKKNLGKEEN